MQAETRKTTIADAIVMEMDQEAETTKRLFGVIPEDKLDWRPHPKAKTLGELAMHIAQIPRGVAELADMDVAEVPNLLPDPKFSTRAELLSAFAESLEKGKAIVGATDDSRAMAEWKLVKGDKVVLAMPRAAFWRAILLNHNYHHRGQLSTYLRQLDVVLPSIYGPSADVNPFG